MIKLDTSTDARWGMALDSLGLEMPQAPKAKPRKASRPRQTPEEREAARQAREAAKREREEAALKALQPKGFWRSLPGKVGAFLTNRARDLALAAIVVGAFVGVFDGAYYSATVFTFAGWSAYAFALMPDALMVLASAKMRQPGITPTQHDAARDAMRFALGFSLVTNMVAALLRTTPWLIEWSVPIAGHQLRPVWVVGAVAYHGVVVWILRHASETLTKVKADRKSASSPDALGMLAGVAGSVVKSVQRKGSGAAVPAQRRGK